LAGGVGGVAGVAGGLGAPVWGVDDDQVGADAEDQAVGGVSDVERGARPAAVLAPVLEPRRARRTGRAG